jgi:hypothetical protein
VLRQRSEGDFAKSPLSAYTSFAPYTLIQQNVFLIVFTFIIYSLGKNIMIYWFVGTQ